MGQRANADEALKIMLAANFEPMQPYPGNSKPWKAYCIKCKRESAPHFSTVKRGSGCAYCAGIKLDETDVRKVYENAGFEPIGKYSGRVKDKWKSRHKVCGKIVNADYAIVRKGKGCSHCAGNTKISEKDARKLFLKNKLEPLEPFQNSQLPWKSKCLITGKTVSPTYGKVRDNGHRCKYCSENVTDEVDAVALMKKSGFKPLVSYPGGNKPWKSECLKCKKIITPSFTTAKQGFGCKYCAKRAVDPVDAVAAMKERGFKTLKPFPGATKPWAVQCLKCNRKFDTVFHSLNTKKRCKYCQRVGLDEKDIAKVLNRLQLVPEEKFPGANFPWKLRCLKCNRVTKPTFEHLTRKDRNVQGCTYCSGHRLDLAEVKKFMTSKKLKPLEPYVNTNTPWLCICMKCGKQVTPRLGDLKQGQSGCIFCAGLKVLEADAIELALKNGFTPIVPYPGANKGWECRCNLCGKVSKPHYTTMQQGPTGCKYCTEVGFDFNSAAIIYLITNENLGAHKIGVAGASEKNERMSKHLRQKWKLFKTMNFARGEDAFLVEQEILRWFRKEKDLRVYLAREQMPQGGSTETVDASEIDLPTIWAKVEEFSRVKR
jgi:hypothetical protein